MLGCTPVAAFIAKNCIPEFHDMALDKIQEFIVYKKAKSEMTPEELAEIQKSNIPPVEISCHPVEDLPDKLNEKNVESKSVNEGTIYYDVLFDIGLPGGKANRVIVDIEAQNKYNPGYHMLNRGSFYCGRMVSAQKESVFHNSDYDKLQKVYSIWLCIDPGEEVRGVCNTYSMTETCLAKEYHFPKEQYDNYQTKAGKAHGFSRGMIGRTLELLWEKFQNNFVYIHVFVTTWHLKYDIIDI